MSVSVTKRVGGAGLRNPGWPEGLRRVYIREVFAERREKSVLREGSAVRWGLCCELYLVSF